MSIATSTIVNRLIKHAPGNVEGLLSHCRLPLRYIGAGLYRSVYHVVGSDVVLKIPFRRGGISHSSTEYKVWKRINNRRSKKFLELKKFMPEVYYFSAMSGFIAMKKYKKLANTRANLNMVEELSHKFMEAMETKEQDIHIHNVGTDDDGSIKIIDMGMFE